MSASDPTGERRGPDAGGPDAGATASGAAAFTVRPGPPSTRFREIRCFADIDSTNRYLVEQARAGAPEGLVVTAAHQRAGRGRLGRRWEAPAGSNLLVSVLVRPALAADELHLVTVVAALAAADACAEVCGVVPALKWPNDLLVGERKLAGVLAEVDAGYPGAADRAVVVGIGLNVDWPPPDTPGGSGEPAASGGPGLGGEGGTDRAVAAELERIAATATSLRREAGWRSEPDDVLDRLLASLESRLGDLVTPAGRSRQAAEYRARCSTLGRAVRVERPGEPALTGTAVDIDARGYLVVEGAGGATTVAAGDVVHIRPAQ